MRIYRDCVCKHAVGGITRTIPQQGLLPVAEEFDCRVADDSLSGRGRALDYYCLGMRRLRPVSIGPVLACLHMNGVPTGTSMN